MAYFYSTITLQPGQVLFFFFVIFCYFLLFFLQTTWSSLFQILPSYKLLIRTTPNRTSQVEARNRRTLVLKSSWPLSYIASTTACLFFIKYYTMTLMPIGLTKIIITMPYKTFSKDAEDANRVIKGQFSIFLRYEILEKLVTYTLFYK